MGVRQGGRSARVWQKCGLERNEDDCGVREPAVGLM